MSAEHDPLVQRLLESVEKQGIAVDLESVPQDPAALLALLHTAAQGETLPEGVEELLAALAAALLRS